MQAVQLDESGTTLVVREVPKPRPGSGELLVRVRAAGITPTELTWYPTLHTKSGEKRIGAVPCHEFSGEVAEAGAGVSEFPVGTAIYGMNDWFADGALAEYCITRPEWVAPKPRLSHAEAAIVPISALTAWQGLFDRAKLQSGERVLVHGGAGAVGMFVIQLARRRGASVITTVSAHNSDFVRELGAGETIDYKAGAFERNLQDIDVVFDTVGGDVLRRSWGVLKSGGRMVTVGAEGENAQEEREKQAFFIVEPNRQQLIEIGALLNAGELRCVSGGVVPFVEAPAAFAGHVGRGKLAAAAPE